MINIIACIDSKNGIGKNNDLPWKNTLQSKIDLARFYKLTKNSTVLMGRNTWYSLPVRPLKNRHNIIMVHNPDTLLIDDPPRIHVTNKIIWDLYKDNDLWIIGGGQIYSSFLDKADFLYLTRLTEDYKCDTLFPEFDHLFELDRIEDELLLPLEIWKRK